MPQLRMSSKTGDRPPARPQQMNSCPMEPQKLPCPRCESTNTKFCYYNNYNLSQPRHFCKACRRYWTRGGTLRKVPVGGGTRKSSSNKRSRTITAESSSSAETDDAIHANSGSMAAETGSGSGSGSSLCCDVNLNEPVSGSSTSSLNTQQRVEVVPFSGFGHGLGHGSGLHEMGDEAGMFDWPMEQGSKGNGSRVGGGGARGCGTVLGFHLFATRGR
ncbi:unnamed protein product [Ilex paraguariensis]|uniref:Dof zinc finger protein n=1 Tax=Ilex paraguariensis TaxID=185542 RepID=A0ABC8RZE6_9AQUA